jgi:type I site-specific restriction-modification system R (restriction) subunit
MPPNPDMTAKRGGVGVVKTIVITDEAHRTQYDVQ